ncbi:MAG: hypothetical protein HOP02_13290 [Methylococcaceae bacterium]|nr:hypothetical protein [Methylococcaceae bacterium]
MSDTGDVTLFAPIKQKQCANCGVLFACGQTEPNGACWCNNVPAVLAPDPAKNCLCRVCLKAYVIEL